MRSTSPLHCLADDFLSKKIELANVFDQSLLLSPVLQSVEERLERENKHAIIQTLFSVALEIFKECVVHDKNPSLGSFLLNDSTEKMPASFYKALPDNVWTIPAFFRTDEARNGSIYEIQCPGSGWGDLYLLIEIYETNETLDKNTGDLLRQSIIDNLRQASGTNEPKILHLLDNSSNPSSMRLFMRMTSSPAQYFGYVRGLRSIECDFIRSHSVQGLISENLFGERLKLAEKGEIRFDLPPIMLFDQKMMLCLPFLAETRDRFSDKVRNCLAYSTPVTSKGFIDIDGMWLSFDDFLKRPSKRRRYYLKYGGCDTNLNWGSRSVFRLDGTDAYTHIKKAIADTELGRPWIIQPEVGDKSQVKFFNRESVTPQEALLNSKYSSFYGPKGLIGVRSQYRRGTKVHSQPDTAVGLVV